jgi:pyridoxal 5'-phosphate synthase pdxT subunit
MRTLVIGVLALQGGFAKHAQMLKSLGAKVIEVRKPSDLTECDALVIPGGESTTMFKQIKFIDLTKALSEFAQKKPVFGTCAGLILISENVIGSPMQPFKILDVDVERNAFGRQAESFAASLTLELKSGHLEQVPAVFIRAPRIRRIGENVQVLARFENEPVLVRQGHHLGATFHPELTSSQAIHAYFLGLVTHL